jgi:hypothetical protein
MGVVILNGVGGDLPAPEKIGQAWAAGQGIFRSEMGAQRREERQLERARRMEEPRIWETGKRDRALSARRSRSSSPTVCL